MENAQGRRIRQFRLANGFTQAELANATGGLITKQAISKYERGKATPSPVVLNKLAEVFNVKTADLFRQPPARIEFVAYRKNSRLGKRKQRQIEHQVRIELERRVKLQDLLGQLRDVPIPVYEYSIDRLEDVEGVADELRRIWELGRDPIADVTSMLEDHHIHVVQVAVEKDFDGISAYAHDNGSVLAAAVITPRNIAGERQRLNLVHELAHLLLEVPESVDEERAAVRMGAALLAPADLIYHDVGKSRRSIQLQELLLLKKRYGLSMQALLYRLRDLNIVSDHHYKQWWITINKMDWKKEEPEQMPPEQPQWLRQHVLRAYSEELLSKEEAEDLLEEPVDKDKEPMTLIKRRSFMGLPIEEQRKILARQAEEMQEHYEETVDEREQWQDGDIIK